MKKILVVLTTVFSLALISFAAQPALASGACDGYSLCSIGEGFHHGWDSHNGRTFSFYYFGTDGIPGSTFKVDLVETRTLIGYFHFNSQGNFSIFFTVPPTLPGGRTYTLRALGRTKGGGQIVVHTVISVSKHCFSRNSANQCTRFVASLLARPGSPALPLGALILVLAILPISFLGRRRFLRPQLTA